jgi:hypothetical protein
MEIHQMTDSPLEQINLLDTDYADILASSSYPALELQLPRPKPAPQAISSALVRQKPETPEQWAALTEAWEAGCGFDPELEDFQLIVELLWNHQRRVEND